MLDGEAEDEYEQGRQCDHAAALQTAVGLHPQREALPEPEGGAVPSSVLGRFRFGRCLGAPAVGGGSGSGRVGGGM
ncbi:hypothetical protein GCM10010297_54260 [Streptomyces malachitofuscus]|nr:hypothetical protein GCM10010297_54260 [Streptomyces malachitofuscus]